MRESNGHGESISWDILLFLSIMVAYYVPVIYLSLLENEKSQKILQSSDSSIFSGLCIYHFSALWNPHFLHILRVRSLVVSDLRSVLASSQLLAMSRGELSAVIVWLMSKCLWSGSKWYRRVKEVTSPFACCPVNRECSRKKT